METVFIFSISFYSIRASMQCTLCSSAVVDTMYRRTFYSFASNLLWKYISVLCVHSAVHHFVWTKVLCSCSSSYLRGILYIHGIFLDEKIHDFSFVSSFISHAHIYIHTNKNWHIFEREKKSKKKHIDRLSCSFQFYTAKIIMVHLKEQI